MKVVNLANGEELSTNMKLAKTFFSRFKGLMFTKSLPEGNGLLIQPCRSIHTFFMNYSIDVLYLSKSLEVVGLEEQVKPSTIGKYQNKAFSVLELPAGTIQRTETKIGNQLLIK